MLVNIFCRFSMNSQIFLKYLQIHRSLFCSNFTFKDSFGILNTRAKKLSYYFFSGFRPFHGQIKVSILKLPSKTAKVLSATSWLKKRGLGIQFWTLEFRFENHKFPGGMDSKLVFHLRPFVSHFPNIVEELTFNAN